MRGPELGVRPGVVAALLQNLALNHPFVDGHKRVAFALTTIFLRINGYKINIGVRAGHKFGVHELIQKRAPLAVVTSWVEAHTTKV